MEGFTETVWIRHVLTNDEVLELAQRMAMAESSINEKADQLKSVSTTIKAEIATQEGILHSSAEKLRSGYEMRPRDAVVTYDKGIVKYVDKDTGEIFEERPMTQEEQLRLNSKAPGAEEVPSQEKSEESDDQ